LVATAVTLYLINPFWQVKDACAEYGMTMVFTNLRLFLH
jgi:hypothetical protein